MRLFMKKRLLSSLFCALLFCMPSAYGTAAAQGEAERLSLIATVFPAFDFARQLAGNTADVSLLLPPGSESHSYEPTPQDIIAIQNADLFLYVGGESDQWVEDIVDSMGADAPVTFKLMECVDVVEEEHTASMEAEHDGYEEHSAEMDEHVWTSPKNAMLIVQSLAQELSKIAPQHAQVYTGNLERYLAELSSLDDAFTEVVKNGKRDLIIFGDRFPLRYFADAYGLRYDAAFPGCSEDSEPSVRTVMSLVEEVREQQIPVVFYIEFSSRKTADILAEETGAKPLMFHSCHNVSAQEMKDGATYMSLMRGNVEALREALN